MPDRDQAAESEDLVLFALVCLAAMRAGALEQQELLRIDAAVRGLQLLAERNDPSEPEIDDAVARMAAVWERYGPGDRTFRPEWAIALRSERRALGDALELAIATVNYWERGQVR